ncbi:MAG TPA: hypothetical protein EYH45_04390 [Candidatus Caldiarchaeum subterraneum]|uniref:Uncharacterized protein n=1 Tax=Caldiarchaeum subterraneum TaxID=311458 RepID=A0A832ZVR4_CALS0|nr:hypothetical protein [Candidatus Caldarchaeum subterraneum]
MPRTSLAVDDGIAQELANLAREKKMTLYALVNEILDTCTKLLKEGADVKTLGNLWLIHKILTEIETVVIPADFMDSLIADIWRYNKDELIEKFRTLGSELSSLLKLYANDVDELLELARTYVKYLPIKNLEARFVGNGIYEIGLVGVGRRIESTVCVAEFLKSLLSSYGSEILDEDISKGVIRMRIRC